MTDATQTGEPVVAYCRTCGRGLTEQSKREVLGVLYCEPCIAARLQSTMPHLDTAAGATPPAPPQPVVVQAVPGAPSPGLAALLGLIPGVGAMYNGQFIKGFAHMLIFASLVWGADHVGEIFGLFVFIFIVYMSIEAYKTAKAKQLGLPAPEDPFGFSRIELGRGGTDVQRIPVGAIVLIGIGVLFLLNNIGYRIFAFGRMWPLILIGIGVWMFIQRQQQVER